jgi:hypothetical protein
LNIKFKVIGNYYFKTNNVFNKGEKAEFLIAQIALIAISFTPLGF